jgi:UDP-N-acetylmuramate-alanine ligase
LLGWLLDCADFDPTIINGGIMNEYNSNILYGKSKWAVV